MNDEPKKRLIWRALRVLGNLVACVAILGASVAAIIVINRTEPTAEKITATRKSSALVETIVVHRGSYAPKLVVLGKVQPAQSISLSPRVRGQVVELSSEFVPGGMVQQGELLLRIDPADFENALAISESELAQAQASLDIEQGRQSLAKKELEMLEGTINDTNRALVLREPQIASIRAEVSAAEGAIERAKLDLERTKIIAPFDAQILSRSVNVGSQVATGDDLGQLVGVDEYWIIATVPVRSLRWVDFPDKAGEGGSSVRLRNPDSWPAGVEREGKVARMIGSLDQQTRLARVLVTIPDPLGLDSDEPPLILETLIETEIEGKPIDDVFRLPRKLVRDSDTVWVMKDDKLEIRDAEIVFQDAEYAYVSSGLDDGDEIVMTTLATVADGVGLRRISDEDDGAADTPGKPQGGGAAE
ncbi:efflux RND transporter periplasmic adaptor subunit [Rhodopirellula sp. MGV]|uniref:efflux RND transporter periplasmic adaptor subunit n=1 Tax=Rhodopirellula sp. MGV TaxID=2023130 RepID=UPI000B9659B8|nr:efflux RND transporter periplasmic adaptor subunit [Rhodopirellula sp. MGV]OYP35168.1 efflux transporter periplasmic adaptor subunit [Rhodopirellula sp. MGV]PNY37817.1 efflux RND transporter periplasmic adaptor subunit [Rhodopirellula baltica]